MSDNLFNQSASQEEDYIKTNNNNGYIDLISVIITNNSEKLNLLIAQGADVNAANEHGITPLMIASAAGNLELMSILIAAGADVNAVDEEGITPLMLAVEPRLLKLAFAADGRTLEIYTDFAGLMKSAAGDPSDIDGSNINQFLPINIILGSDANIIYGDSTDNTLYATSIGSNILTGNGGKDIFVINERYNSIYNHTTNHYMGELDIITDFNPHPAGEKIDISAFKHVTSLNDLTIKLGLFDDLASTLFNIYNPSDYSKFNSIILIGFSGKLAESNFILYGEPIVGGAGGEW
jgi:Ca2+-binding RTX toxin-like protein